MASITAMAATRSVFKLNDTQKIRFIQLYQSEELLWNPQLESYRNNDDRLTAAKRIAKSMAIPGFQAEHVMEKIKSLRNSYCQELKKISASEKSSISSEDVYKQLGEWFKLMDSFLKPYSYVALSNIQGNSISHSKVKKCEEITIFDRNCEGFTDSDSNDSTVTQLYIPNVPYTKEVRNTVEDNNVLKKIKIENPITESYSDNLPRKNIGNVIFPSKTKNLDSFDHFGKYIASVLRDLPHRKACVLVQKITNIAMESMKDLNR